MRYNYSLSESVADDLPEDMEQGDGTERVGKEIFQGL